MAETGNDRLAGDRWTFGADRIVRGKKLESEITASSCVEQLKGFADNLQLSEGDKQVLLDLSVDMYLLGRKDVKDFISYQVGITIDSGINGKVRNESLKELYDEFRPNHGLSFE